MCVDSFQIPTTVVHSTALTQLLGSAIAKLMSQEFRCLFSHDIAAAHESPVPFVLSHDRCSSSEYATDCHISVQDLESTLGVESIVEENARHVAELILRVRLHWLKPQPSGVHCKIDLLALFVSTCACQAGTSACTDVCS